jgi:hypothetical protein
MTDEEIFAVIATYREAVRAKDWSTAREAWEQLAPWHPMLFARTPSFAYTAEVLRHQEAMVLMTERLSTAIH